MKIGNSEIGPGHKTYVIAEVGINHNGSIQTAYDLMTAAKVAGCDAVKFQKRTPKLAVPKDQWDKPKETPWGETIPYLEYRERMEFSKKDYRAISDHARHLEIDWFVSVWDVESVDFMLTDMPSMAAIKIPSAKLTDKGLLEAALNSGLPLLMSTGMSTWGEMLEARKITGGEGALMVCHSAYPAPVSELNLKLVPKMIANFGHPVGYSGHEVGLSTTVAAVALGASIIERHITLDRSAKGSDHAASVEPQGFIKLVKWIRSVEQAMGDGVKRVWESELPAKEKLRGV